jgi:hypothetical protein
VPHPLWHASSSPAQGHGHGSCGRHGVPGPPHEPHARAMAMCATQTRMPSATQQGWLRTSTWRTPPSCTTSSTSSTGGSRNTCSTSGVSLMGLQAARVRACVCGRGCGCVGVWVCVWGGGDACVCVVCVAAAARAAAPGPDGRSCVRNLNPQLPPRAHTGSRTASSCWSCCSRSTFASPSRCHKSW